MSTYRRRSRGSRPVKPFAFTEKNRTQAEEIIKRYPPERKASGLLPILDMVQRQNEGWLSQEALGFVADYMGLPLIRVMEVASFYSMFYLEPKGKYHVKVCGTPPCGLCGSDKLLKTCQQWLGIKPGETTTDRMFSLTEVECLGACSNAPVVQVNDDYYEDLSPESLKEILEALAEDKKVPAGSAKGRQGSAPLKEKGEA